MMFGLNGIYTLSILLLCVMINTNPLFIDNFILLFFMIRLSYDETFQ